MNVIDMKVQNSRPGEKEVVDLIITWDKPAMKKKDDHPKKDSEPLESGSEHRTTQESCREEATPKMYQDLNRVVRPAKQ